MKIVIIGAVAAGTSAAAKARRNSEEAEIIIFEKDTDISYSGCGLPYYIGGDVEDREKLTPRDPEFFREKYNVDVRTAHEVKRIDTEGKFLEVKDLVSGKEFTETYDKLVIATGARSFVPKMEGVEKKNVFTLRNVKNADAIRGYLRENSPKKVLIVGTGFIGLELCEVLVQNGIEVTMVEKLEQVTPGLDRDMSKYLEKYLKKKGVRLILGTSVTGFKGDDRVQKAVLESGEEVETDMVIMSIGVRPNVELARDAGVKLGVTGAIMTDTGMRTSIEDVYACGDCAESFSLITGKPIYRPLGSTANKTGRICGSSMFNDSLEFRGVLGTGIFRVFDMVVGQTGLTEREALIEGYDIEVIHNIKPNRPEYYGGKEMVIKGIADRNTEKLLGVQIVGYEGVDKRIDVFVTAISFGAKVSDLFHLDLAYAPPFSTTKDPVMYTGMILDNAINTSRKIVKPAELLEGIVDKEDVVIIDTRVPKQYAAGHVDGAVNIPHNEIRKELKNLDKEKTIITYCNKGVTGNAVQNILLNSGFEKVYNISGGNSNYQTQKTEEKKDK
ncbi:MAG TPA: FAD-dependent oxidoreductase [Clostridiaceae bacterium]|nr:FAD-dependent oxidoreductase [Clostridiaceae bacterium]